MMAPRRKSEKSPSSTPVPSTEVAQVNDGSQLPDAEWEAMQKVLNAIYDYRTEDGFDPSKLFHRRVNKRVIPEYYETIQEPMALSVIKHKIHTRAYQGWAEFVRDFALIPYNAQVFNRPDSGAFQDALIIKAQIEKQLQLLVEDGVIKKEVALLPHLGEIPTFEEPLVENGDGDEDEDDSDDDGDEDDEEEEAELDDEGKPRRKRGRPRSGTISRRDGGGDDGDSKRPRGRPPRLFTPTEARILAVMKGIRKPKNQEGALMFRHFERLPDKAVMPEYYAEVKNPMAFDVLKRKVKRKKYPTLEAFMADVNLMFNNAKEYNKDDSQIFKDAVALQVEAGKLYDAEKAKPDDTFADEDGKIPMSNGILHNGELYKVGDWVHIQNPNDLTKPLPAQIYRTYKNPNGQGMVNVCWYYRPEQTVHRFDKHFLTNEIVKTGRYRDHHIEEVEGKCFVMFYTRFFKGRPRNLPEGTEVYVCKDRYNETLHQFNTIKTWASCLPDEVRDKDYEMDLFEHVRKMKKHPSPLAYLLKDDQKEDDELPRVQWGADGAPPKIGAVHRRPRNEKDSPPPEPTPPPPAKIETPTPRPTIQSATSYQPQPSFQQHSQNSGQPVRPPSTGARPQTLTSTQSSYTPRPPTASPAPQRAPSIQPSVPPITPQPQTVQSSFATRGMDVSTIPSNPMQGPRAAPVSNYKDPPPIEVYTLPDHANLSIPLEVREQYKRDEFGRVLFFTTPPVAVSDITGPGSIGNHSVRYLAEKARRAETLARKRKEREVEAYTAERAAKAAQKAELERTEDKIDSLKRRALAVVEQQLARTIDKDFRDKDLVTVAKAQTAATRREATIEENARLRTERKRMRFGEETFGDDLDNRIT